MYGSCLLWYNGDELGDRPATITSSEGKEFTVSSEVLTIERKTFKQSGKVWDCITLGDLLMFYTSPRVYSERR
jgi:hypothetical protein